MSLTSTYVWLPSALALVLALLLFAAYRSIARLRNETLTLREELGGAQAELALLDERVKRRSAELEQAQGVLVELDPTDHLTGLANRQRFEDVLANEFTRLKRSGQPLSVLVMGLDHFQNYRDVHGAAAADTCLKTVGALLVQRMKRPSDLAARLQGGEFGLVLPETDFAGAKTVAEHLRKGVEALALPHNGSAVSRVATVSIGLATVTTTHMGSSDESLGLATSALARAREAGGNGVAGSQRVRAAA